MRKEDLSQVAEIDREAFPTQWPPPNYRHELELALAHYLVALEETGTSPDVPGPKNDPRSPVSLIKRLFKREGTGTKPSSSTGQDIIGFAGIWVMTDEAHITNIAVRKQYQRRRIGELLLISLIDLANHLNASFMTLEVRVSNSIAQNLYAKYGFKQVGIRPKYYLDNREDGMLMSSESITSTSFQEHFQKLKQDYFRKERTQSHESASER
ncbi:ribosomal protein S18-alanine N-acetyltransferase [Chloroflexota bacterium]